MNEEKDFLEEAEEYDGKKRTKLFSIICLLFGLVSIGFCFTFQITPAILGVTGIVFAFISRKNLDYYDGICLAGFILSLIGTLVGLTLFLLNVTGLWENLLTSFAH